MARGGKKFQYDAIVFHDDDEMDNAEKFCEQVRKIDRTLKIVTMESYSRPGQLLIDTLNSALRDAEYIFFSNVYYHTNDFGNFSGGVANHNKIPEKFVVLKVGYTGESLPTFAAAHSLQLQKDWSFTEATSRKIKTFFLEKSRATTTKEENQQNREDESLLEVENMSISETSSLAAEDETSLKRPHTTTQNAVYGRSNDDPGRLSSLTGADLMVDTGREEAEDQSIQDPASTLQGLPVNRVIPQPRPVASPEAAGSDTMERHAPDGAETSRETRSTLLLSEEQREELSDYL